MNFQSFYNDPRNFLFQNLEILLLGIITSIYIIIVVIIAVKMIGTYHKYKVSQHLFSAIAYFGVASTYSGIVLNLISVLIFNIVPLLEVHILINGGLVTICNFFWIMTILAISNLKQKIRRVILIILGIFTITIEIMFISLVLIDATTVMTYMITPIYGDYTLFTEIFYFSQVIVFVSFGLWMSIKSLKSKNEQIKLKGKLLMLSFGLFFIGALSDVVITETLLFIVGLIFISNSAIFFYLGFILPDWLKKLLIKEENNS